MHSTTRLSTAAFDLLNVGVLIIDQQCCVVEWNEWLSKRSAVSAAAAKGQRLDEIFPDVVRGRLGQAITHALDAQLSSTLSSAINRFVFPLTKFDGSSLQQVPIAQSLLIKPIVEAADSYCMICIHDVTETVKREGILREKSNQLQKLAKDYEVSEQRSRGIIESSLDSVLTFTLEGLVQSLNPAARGMFGIADEREAVLSIFDLLPELSVKKDIGVLEGLVIDVSNGWPKLMARRIDGVEIPVEYSVRYVDDLFYTMVLHDLTEREAVEKRLKRLAQYDGLTGLANRRLFTEVLATTVMRARQHGELSALMLLDLDRFKSINDSMGHEAGDELLSQVSSRLEGCFRDDDLVARLGGDEFAIVLNSVGGSRGAQPTDSVSMDVGVGFVTRAAERVVGVFSEPFNLQGREVFSSASIGIAMCSTDTESEARLTKCADVALYAAKDQGRNNYQFYTENLDKACEIKLGLENNLHHALKNRELMLSYQPQISRATGEICGVEALLRWRHPSKGNISPEVFVPLLEATGLIQQVGEWVLSEACMQRKRWQASKLLSDSCPMAVNISGKQFNGALLDAVRKAMGDAGIEPCMLEVELTESTLMEKTQETNALLNELSGMGVAISIDDFGTGYSSLSYLKDFPVSSLKVDKSFVIDIIDNDSSSSIAEAVIALAHTMGLKVVAEGVETQQALDVLSRFECDVFQGFLFSKALNVEDFECFARQQHWQSLMPPVSSGPSNNVISGH